MNATNKHSLQDEFPKFHVFYKITFHSYFFLTFLVLCVIYGELEWLIL